MSAALSIEWKLAADGAVLRVLYRFTNPRPLTVYLLDQLVRPGPTGFARCLEPVIAEGEPGTARLTVGFVPPGTTVPFLVAPGARAVGPGQALAGMCEARLPLAVSHPYREERSPMSGPIERVVLELGFLDGDGTWLELPLAGGGSLTVPGLPFAARQELAVSEPLPLPPASRLPAWTDGLV